MREIRSSGLKRGAGLKVRPYSTCAGPGAPRRDRRVQTVIEIDRGSEVGV